MSNELKSPARLNITDLPRDVQRCTGALRQTLVASTNYCRRYPAKLEILKGILKYVYNYIVQVQKYEHEKAKEIEAQKAAKEAAEKELADAEALALKEAKEAAEAELKLAALKATQSQKESK
jgi:hypothetical protein